MDTKDKVINDVLIYMRPHIKADNIRLLETALAKALYNVEVIAKETALSTETDDNAFLLDAYETHVTKDGLSEYSIGQYMASMRNLLAAVNKNIRHITSMDVKLYLDWKSEQGNTAVTVNNERRFLSAVFTWYQKHGVVTINPVEAVPIRKEIRKPIDYLTGEQIEYVREACKNNRERALVEFLLSTGVRVGEIPAIKYTDICWQTGEVVIYGHKTREYRTVYLTDICKVHIKKYLDSRDDMNPHLFASEKKPFNTMKEAGLRSIIKEIGGRSRLDRGLYPHLFRKTLLTILRMKGCPTEDAQQIAGHSTPATTLRFYAATTSQQLRQQHNKYMAQGA